MENISRRSFTKQRKQFLQTNDKLYEGVELPTKNIRSSAKHRYHQASTWMKKMSWQGNIESHLCVQVIIFLHQPAIFKDDWKTQFLGSMKRKRMIQLWPLQICLETLSTYNHLKMGMEEFVS